MQRLLVLIVSYLGFVAALILVLCVVFGTRLNQERDLARAVSQKTKPESSKLEVARAFENQPPQNEPTKVEELEQPDPRVEVRQVEKLQTKPLVGEPRSLASAGNEPRLNSISGTGQFFTLELHVFRDRTRAEHLAGALLELKLKPYVLKRELNGENFYSVRLGKFKTEKDAIKQSRNLHSKTKIAARIVKKI